MIENIQIINFSWRNENGEINFHAKQKQKNF